MKALYTLIIPILLAGCSHLKPATDSSSDVAKTDVLKTVAADKKVTTEKKVTVVEKVDTSKAKIVKPEQVETLPLLSPSILAKHSVAPTPTPSSTATPSAKTESAVSVEPEPFEPTKVFKVGSRGEAVRNLEQRLTELHYDVGKVDNYYDKQTRQGVLAFQKYNQLKRTGTYTLETQKALYEATPPEGEFADLGLPRIEVDLSRQVLLFFDKKGLNRVIAISSGTNRKYCEKSKKSRRRVCGVAHTPRGTFRVQRRIPGWRESDLGKLYNPLYFNGGYAIHGAPSVPHYNASHGCVRISIATSMWFYDKVENGTPVVVFD